MNNIYKIRIKTVENYLENRVSLRTIGNTLKIPYQTIHRWVKWYKEGGKENLKREVYRRPWNKREKDIEESIALLKEREPALTIRKAKKILENEGIEISLKGIWGIWKRYGYAGYKKENMWNDFVEYIPWSKEAKRKFEQAKEIFAREDMKKTAEIVNSIPCLPTNDLILKIPETLLNLHRQIEKMSYLSQKISLPIYLKKIRELYKKCKKRHLNYSALRLGTMEVMALEWSTKPLNKLQKIKELKKIICKDRDYYSSLLFEPYFTLLISEGIAYTFFSKINRAQKIARTCRNLLKRRKNLSPYFMADLGALHVNMEDYKEAEYWLIRACKKVDEDTKDKLKAQLAYIFLCKGKFREATTLFKNPKLTAWTSPSWKKLCLAQLSLMKGMPQKAISLSVDALSILKKEKINTNLFGIYFTTASAYCSIGERTKAKKLLINGLNFFKKKKLRKYVNIFKILIQHTPSSKTRETFPSAKLALLLKNSEYWKAFSYAKKKYLLSYLYRYVFFFSETVIEFLKKGKPTGLPKAILKLPAFNKEFPVYNIRFLGNLIVYRNEQYLKVHPVRKKIQLVSSDSFKSKPGTSLVSRVRRKFSNGVKLQPKDVAFLTHLALRAGEPGSKIPLGNIYNNFWRDSVYQARNLSHLLVRVKKTLKIPSHLLEISYRKDEPVLINRGIHFITDYNELKQVLVTAQAFLRAGEWNFAKREYLRAFKLFRGEPFKKMYDNWSEQMRRVILNKLETEAINFAKSCMEHKNKKDARKVLEKVLKIIPDSEEIKVLSQKLRT